MFKFITTLLILASLTGCDKAATVRKAEEKASELRIYNRNILRATNDAREATVIRPELHRAVITAGEKFSLALDRVDGAIKIVKAAPDRGTREAGLDYVQRLIDSDVFIAFADLVDAAVGFPPNVKAKIDEAIAAIKLIFAAIRSLFADSGRHVLGRLEYV